jgi:hypothetical protein
MKRNVLILLSLIIINLGDNVAGKNSIERHPVDRIPDNLPLEGIKKSGNLDTSPYSSGKPYTRWWWFASIIKNADIRDQLNWLKKNNFGGVEIAFVYPVNRNPKTERFLWLGTEWQNAVSYAKQYADSIGLGCDFTFGTLWPFGGTFVKDRDRTRIWGDPDFRQPLARSWTMPDTGNVVNHLDRSAFDRYAKVMGDALSPALKGHTSAIFCDSWEVETKRIWTEGFDQLFQKQFGYDIRPFMDSIYSRSNAGPRYDYMKLVSQLVLHEFYIPFTSKAHELGALSRVQCAGAPVDLIKAYASIDIPETEAMLYEPGYSKIVSSAAALSGKTIISSETFTCLYGWPAKNIRNEQTADLKLVADALFANGVNQIIWHGMPYNPAGIDTIYFYASVHVGKKGSLAEELPSFNDYLTRVSEKMRIGKPYSDIAVYLPTEDSWIAGEYPKELQLPWSWGAYEMRYEHFNPELKGYQPLWINNDFLSRAKFENNTLLINDIPFKMLYIDVKYLDIETLRIVFKLASKGLPVCLKQIPVQSGHIRDKDFGTMLVKLRSLLNVEGDFKKLVKQAPLVQGDSIPQFWCRTTGKTATLFFANPKTATLTYPVAYGQSLQDAPVTRHVTLNFNGRSTVVKLQFKPYQSLLLTIDEKGKVCFDDILFMPKVPVQK